MIENNSPQEQPDFLHQPDQQHSLSTWEKVRVGGALAVLAVGQAAVIRGIYDGNFEEVIVADAIAVPLALGLTLSITEMRRRLPIIGQRTRNYLREPIFRNRRQQG